MRVLYYTAGVTGSGHVVRGISTGFGLRRLDPSIEFSVLNQAPLFGALCGRVGVDCVELPGETEAELGPGAARDSRLFEAIVGLKPDVLVVDMYWFNLDAFLDDLPCKKLFLTRQVQPRFFEIPLPDRTLRFDPGRWDACVACEPWQAPFPVTAIDPIVMRERDEILPRAEALRRLGLSGGKKVFMLTLNGLPGLFEKAQERYSYLSDEGWDTVYTSNFHGGIFPAVDCFNAVDLLACGAGYNSLWEAVYFGKETVYLPRTARFEDAWERMDRAQGYTFRENGANTLARLIVDL